MILENEPPNPYALSYPACKTSGAGTRRDSSLDAYLVDIDID